MIDRNTTLDLNHGHELCNYFQTVNVVRQPTWTTLQTRLVPQYKYLSWSALERYCTAGCCLRSSTLSGWWTTKPHHCSRLAAGFRSLFCRLPHPSFVHRHRYQEEKRKGVKKKETYSLVSSHLQALGQGLVLFLSSLVLVLIPFPPAASRPPSRAPPGLPATFQGPAFHLRTVKPSQFNGLFRHPAVVSLVTCPTVRPHSATAVTTHPGRN